MSFPINPFNGQVTTQNGIIYEYSTSTNSWRRTFNQVIDQLFIGGLAQSTATNNGALVVSGGAGIGKNLNVGGSLNVNETFSVNGTSYINPIGGDVYIQPTLNGTVVVYPSAVGSIDNMIIGADDPQVGYFTNISVTSTASSVSSSTGALVVAGGVGIGKDLHVGGNIYAHNFVAPNATWYYTSTNYTASNGDHLLIDTSATTVTVYLPLLPSVGDTVQFIDYSGTFGSNNATFGRNGKNIMGTPEDLIVDVDFASNYLVYTGEAQGWKIGVIF